MIPISLLFTLNLASNHLAELTLLSQRATPPVISTTRNRPSPPPKLPPNRVRPGGGLDSTRASCKAASQSVTALVPEQNPVLTTSAHPKLLFYIPDAGADVRLATFSVFTQDEKTRVYETRFTLPQSPGIVSIALPEAPAYALEEGQTYHWYLKLYCQDTSDEQADLAQSDLSIDGWIQRVTLTPNRQQQIDQATPDIWYDALANVASQLQSNPQATELRQRWNNLLRTIGLENLAAQPFTDSISIVQR